MHISELEVRLHHDCALASCTGDMQASAHRGRLTQARPSPHPWHGVSRECPLRFERSRDHARVDPVRDGVDDRNDPKQARPRSVLKRPRRRTTARSHGAAILTAIATIHAITKAVTTTATLPTPSDENRPYASATPAPRITQNSSTAIELDCLIVSGGAWLRDRFGEVLGPFEPAEPGMSSPAVRWRRLVSSSLVRARRRAASPGRRNFCVGHPVLAAELIQLRVNGLHHCSVGFVAPNAGGGSRHLA